MTTITKSQAVAGDIAALIRARNPLLWIVTREEARVERYLLEAAAAASYVTRTWDVAQGLMDMDGKLLSDSAPGQDPGEALNIIRDRADPKLSMKTPERTLWIMRDLPAWLSGPAGATTQRQLRNLARTLPSAPRERAQAIVVLTPSSDVPPELAGHTTVIEWPMPDRAEIADTLDAAIEALPEEIRKDAASNGTRDAAIDAAVGLSGEEAASCYARSLVQHRRIDPVTVAHEKKRVIAREGLLEWYDPIPGGLDSVGGLDNLKAWLAARRTAYSPEARAYGLPAPKGAVLVGIPGCGKSLTAKAIATAWGVPLLRFDLGAQKSKFVGESEGKIRKAFRVVDAIGRCVVWFDEIEKSVQGATSGSADGGVSSDALGVVLTWMQERTSESFVIATANDAESLPPELLRKGRFDEVWWVDLPTLDERAAVLAVTLRGYKREIKPADLRKVAEACEGFTGSEIAALVPDALFTAFADKARALTAKDLLAAASTVVPLSKTAEEKIARLRTWAKGRARPATAPTTETTGARSTSRQIDI